MEKTEGESTANLPGWLYVLAPFFLLLLCLGFINFVPGRLVADATPPVVFDQSVTATTAPRATAVPTTLLPTSAGTETPFPTITPRPTLPPGLAITLLGPPNDSRFRIADTVSFFGYWPVALADGQQMTLYLRLNGKEVPLAALDEPNMGTAYHWSVAMDDLTETAVVEWFVRLQSESSATVLLESETRTLQIMP